MPEIEEGKYYKTRGGRKVGPMVPRESYGKCPWGLPSGPQRWYDDWPADELDAAAAVLSALAKGLRDA